MAKGFITKRAVDACKPGDRQFVLWDAGDRAVKGFGLLVLPSGAKSYVFQYRIGGRAGRLRRYTIGKHGSPWTPDSARERALVLAEQVRAAIDPIEAERSEIAARESARAAAIEHARSLRELAFDAYVQRFLALGLKSETRPRTREGYASTFRNHVTPVLANKPLPEITQRDIVRVLDRAPTGQPAVRRITFAVMRLLFNWAKGRGDIAASPLEGMDTPPTVASRDRVLSDDELALALRAAGSIEAPFGPLYQMLFATGQRREEVAGMDWAELDRASATWTLPGIRAKNGEASIVPLNRHAVAALDRMAGQEAAQAPEWPRRGLIFTSTGQTAVSGYSRAKARLDARMEQIARQDATEAGRDPDEVALAPWLLHDARRTLATALQRLGVRFEVTEAVLNHVSGASRSGVAGVYQRHGWGPEKRAALDAWADHCERLLNPAGDTGNVVPLRANAPA
jgi:integrase